MNHSLKCNPPFFEDVRTNDKPFELRKNDRPFSVGDMLFLQEYCPVTKDYSGRECRRRISYILSDYPGLCRGYVILGLVEVTDY